MAESRGIAEYYARTLSRDTDFENLEWGNVPEAKTGSMADKLAQRFEYNEQKFEDKEGKNIVEYTKEDRAKRHRVSNLDFYVFRDGSYLAVAPPQELSRCFSAKIEYRFLDLKTQP